MWKDISARRIEDVMSQKKERYLAFVDYLGTRELYADALTNGERIIDRRSELEHSIKIRLQQLIARKQIEIGLFSDTVLIAGDDIADVLKSSTSLMEYVFAKTLDRNDVHDIRLLRGAVSRGIQLRSSYLQSSPGVSVIPFFDGSLSVAYALEGVRKGSRLFLRKDLASTEELKQYVFSSEVLTGAGSPTTDVDEFLWPAFVCSKSPKNLLSWLKHSLAFWRTAQKEVVDPDLYRATVHHMDETIKCIIRSSICFRESPVGDDVATGLVQFLPTEADPMHDCNIRYVWGIWFQILFVLCAIDRLKPFDNEVRFTLEELRRRNYLDKFLGEMDYAHYAVMRDLRKFL